MLTKKTSQHLATTVLDQLQDLQLKLCVPQITLSIWEDLFAEHERRDHLEWLKRHTASAKTNRASNGDRTRTAQTPEFLIPADVLHSYARSRRLSAARTIADLAHQVKLLSDMDHRRLRREIGEPLEPAPSLPAWDSEAGELRYEGDLIRKVSVRAANIRRLLNCFEEQHWPSRVDSPLPGGKNSKKLRASIASLNEGLKTLRFYADGGAGGIRWHVDSATR